jgi:hypothetical protein
VDNQSGASHRNALIDQAFCALGGAGVGLIILLPLLLVASGSEEADAFVGFLFPLFALSREWMFDWVGGRAEAGAWLPYVRSAVQASALVPWALYGLVLCRATRARRLPLGIGAILISHVIFVVLFQAGR